MSLDKVKDIGLHQRTGLYHDGKEILVAKKRGRPPRRIHNPENGWWSQEKKVEACTLYIALGTVDDVSRLVGVPANVIRQWKTEQWWIEITSQVTRELDDQLSSKFTSIVNSALDKLSEVLEKGNKIYFVKTDKFVEVPLSGSDLAKIAAAFTDKRQLIQGKPTTRSETVTSDDRLKDLAKRFEQFTKAKEVVQEKEVEVVNG